LPVSIIIMTKNEEIHIEKCLDSVFFANEIFVVDSNSTDKTTQIALLHGAKVINFTWDGKYPKKKNWCLINLPFSNDWVIMLDADEEIPDNAIPEIGQIVSGESKYDAYYVRFYYVFLNKTIKHGDPVRKLIFFKHALARFTDFDDYGHREVEGSEQPVINGRVGIFKTPFIHNNLKGVHDFFARHNAYSSRASYLIFNKKMISPMIKSEERNTLVRKREIAKRIFVRLPFKPLIYFIYGYIFKLGFLDGLAGLYYNLCKAIYYLEVEMKLYELKKMRGNAGEKRFR